MLALYSNYFSAAQHLYTQIKQAEDAIATTTGDERDQTFRRMNALLPVWLSVLHTACEGFQKLECKDPAVESRIKVLKLPLTRMWEHTVHYHSDTEQKLGRSTFYGTGKLKTAGKLQNALEAYFINYVDGLDTD